MIGCYCAYPALQTAVHAALDFYGLEASPFAVNRRPRPARTFGEQQRRIDLGGKVLAMVRRMIPVGPDDRRLIERLVDAACERIENGEPVVDRQDVRPAPSNDPTRRPAGPSRPSSPTKTNPTRAIRSSRWTRKAVRP
jgi:hypothetical protein